MHLERPQVAAVDADDVRAGVERAPRARPRSCTSTSAASPKRSAAAMSRFRSIVERGHDQEHGARPGRRRLRDLVLGDDEVLAEQRQGHGARDIAQVIERAVEERGLGQDRDRRGAGALVGGGDGHRMVVRAEHAAGRRAPLALGNHADARRFQRSRGTGRRQARGPRSRDRSRSTRRPSRVPPPIGARRRRRPEGGRPS